MRTIPARTQAIDIDVYVFWKNDTEPTLYHFDEIQAFVSFIWDCKSCGALIDHLNFKECITDIKIKNIDKYILRYASKSLIKKLGGEYLLNDKS